MIQEVRRIKPFSLAKVTAALSFIMSLIFFIPFLIFAIFGSDRENATDFIDGFVLAMPVFYFIFGYIFGLISGFVYNLVAKYMGGIKLELE